MGGSSGGSERIITEDMRAAAEVATAQWNDYQTRLRPFEDRFIADMTKDGADHQAALRGRVSADLAQQSKNAGLVPGGTQPGKALQVGALRQGAIGMATASGLGDVTQRAVDRQAQGMSTAVSMGRGQASDALQTQMGLAEMSSQVANERAAMAQQDRFATNGLIMQGIGAAAGLGAYGMEQGWFSGNPMNQPAGTMTLQEGSRAAVGGNGLYSGSNGGTYLQTSGGRWVPYKP